MTYICLSCHTPNRANARFCIHCGATLTPAPLVPRGSAQSWLAQVQQTLSLVWTQGNADVCAFFDEWIARRPLVAGAVVGSPRQTQVTIVVQGLFGPMPFSDRQSQQQGLLLQIQDARLASPVDVILIGAQQGTPPQHGDDVLVWGQWDAGMNAHRAWRVQITQRSGQPTNLELTTGRPIPFALLSLIFLALVLLSCLCSLFVRVF